MQAKWTQDILDEALGSLARDRPDIAPEKLTRLRELINSAIPDCLVTGYEPLIEGLKLPDPKDRHVLAAAIKIGAQVIVTANLKHFPAELIAPWNIEAKSPGRLRARPDQHRRQDRVRLRPGHRGLTRTAP